MGGHVDGDLVQVALLQLVHDLELFLRVLGGHHGGSERVQVLTVTVVGLGDVEVVRRIHRGGGDAVAAGLNREVLRGDDARHFGGTVVLDGQLDADLLHLLDQELCGGADNRVATEGDDRVGDLSAVLSVVVAGLAVACVLKDLGGDVLAELGRVVVLVAFLHGQHAHGAGQGFLPAELLVAQLLQLLTVEGCNECAADGQGHLFGVDFVVANAQGTTLTDVGVCHAGELVVGAEGAGVRVVDFAVLVGCLLCLGAHFTPGDALEGGLGAPPLLVADDGEHLGGGVPLADLEGACPVLVEGLVVQAVVEELGFDECRVQERGEATFDGVPGLGHDDLHVAVVAIHGFNAGDLLPDGRGGDLVVRAGCRSGVDGLVALDGVHVDGGAVVEGCLRVDLEGHGLDAVNGLCLVLGDVVLVHVRFAAEVGVEAAGECGVDGCLNVQVACGVAVGVEDVEVRADAVSAQAQFATVLEGGAVLLVVGDCLGEVVTCGECVGFGLGGVAAAGCEQADGAQGDGAGEQGTTVEGESGH